MQLQPGSRTPRLRWSFLGPRVPPVGSHGPSHRREHEASIAPGEPWRQREAGKTNVGNDSRLADVATASVYWRRGER